MSLNESWPRYEPFSPHVLNDDLAHFDDRHQFDPSPYGQSSPYDFDDAPELALERFDTRCPDMFNGSSWPSVPSQTFDYVHCQEEQLYPFDDTTILQSGSIGRCESEYSHSSPDWSAITQYDGHQFEPASRGGRSRGVEAQPVKCSECHQMFDSLQSLEQHTKTELHKIWRCPDMGCGKAYPRRDTLARHQLKHSDKGHACSICQQNNKHKVFKRRDHLAEHIRKRHAPSTDDMRYVNQYRCIRFHRLT